MSVSEGGGEATTLSLTASLTSEADFSWGVLEGERQDLQDCL